MNPFISNFIVPFFRHLFSWRYFTPSQISAGLFFWSAYMILHKFITIYGCLTLNYCLLSNLLGAPYKPVGRALQMLRWLTSRLLQAFLTCKDIFYLINVWCVTGWFLSTNVSQTSICCMYPFGQKRDIAASVRYNELKHYLCRFIHDMIIPNAYISVDGFLNDFIISFLCQFWSFIYIYQSS